MAMDRRFFLRVTSGLLLGSACANQVNAVPIRPVVFEGMKEDTSGLTLRFGNGVDHNEITFTGMKKLSLKDAKRLIELTGKNVKSIEMVKALEALGL